jgi:Flp pilus assembly pilin Flp
MLRFLWSFLNFAPSQRAQAMTEYILIVALVALALIVVFVAFRNVLAEQLNKIIVKLGGTSTPPENIGNQGGDTGSSGASTRGVC